MHRVLKKNEILTIPNLLSVVRLLLIPLIVWLYCEKREYYAATAIVMLSRITDIADGVIARKINLVSDFGKILDPVADKLTQDAWAKGVILLEAFERKPSFTNPVPVRRTVAGYGLNRIMQIVYPQKFSMEIRPIQKPAPV